MGQENGLTIIIPTIGRPELLNKTLDSAICQLGEHCKILLSDNYATPPVELPQQHQSNKQIRVIRRPQRLSFVEHMNVCLAEADEGIIMLLSDDDLLHPDLVKLIRKLFRDNESLVMVLPEQIIIDGDYSGPAPNGKLTYSITSGREVMVNLMRGNMKGVHTVLPMVARRFDLLAVGGFGAYPSGAHSDNILFFRLCLRGSVAVIAQAYAYRVYAQSFGLSMPWEDLVEGTKAYSTDLTKLVEMPNDKEFRSEIASYRRGLGKLLTRRWFTLYRKRLSLRKNARAIFVIIFFMLSVLLDNKFSLAKKRKVGL
jgi:glycosyltransferase involved in cell wall biosynthesis